MGTFPFGRPVQACTPVADGPRRVFVLGAYPSALHVCWRPPVGWRVVRALAVDNEPEPFWTGADEGTRLDAWASERGWQHDWGSVEPVKGLNGPSGAWVEQKILGRVGVDRSNAWITDCLDTYRASTAMQAAIASVYAPFAEAHGLPGSVLLNHPSENQIVSESVAQHRERLVDELGAAQSEIVITLGNAALRVFRALVDVATGPAKLAADADYGAPIAVSVRGSSIRWFPVAHPAAPATYQSVHETWKARLS